MAIATRLLILACFVGALTSDGAFAQQSGYDHRAYDGDSLRVMTFNLGWASPDEQASTLLPNWAWDFSIDRRPDYYETVDLPRWKKALDDIEYVSPHILSLQEGDPRAYRQLRNSTSRQYAFKESSPYWKADYRLSIWWDDKAFQCIDSGEAKLADRRLILFVQLKEKLADSPHTLWVFCTQPTPAKDLPLKGLERLKKEIRSLTAEGRIDPVKHTVILAGDFNLKAQFADDLLCANIFNTDERSTGKSWPVYERPYSQEEHARHIANGTWLESFLPGHNSFCLPNGSRVLEGAAKGRKDLSNYSAAKPRGSVDHVWVYSPITSISGVGDIDGRAALLGDLPYQPMCTWEDGPTQQWDNASYQCRWAWEQWNRGWHFFETTHERWENKGSEANPVWECTQSTTWPRTVASDHHPRTVELRLNN